MCGILAILSTRPTPRPCIESGLKAMHHRGPDHSGIWQSNDQKVSLGHCRLHVRGSADANQPLIDLNKEIVAVVNGEFYDAAKLRGQLEKKGHYFSTDSDSELAIHLYKEYGLGLFPHLRGEFALAIWDQKRNQLIAIRDRFGIKPLYYTLTDSGVALASEAKALFAAEVEQPRWDIDSFSQSLVHQYLLPDRSLFEDIVSLPPANYAIFSENQPPQIKQYWSPTFDDKPGNPEEIEQLLVESIKLRLESNTLPAFTLSSGIDSTSVASIASQISSQPIHAFSVSFCDGDEFDEAALTKDQADQLGFSLDIIPVSREAMLSDLSDATYYSEGLSINGQLVGKYRLAQAIRAAGHNVVLSGEGADEAFLGYAHLQADANLLNDDAYKKQRGVMLPCHQSNVQLPPPPKWLKQWPTFIRAKYQFCQQFQSLLKNPIPTEPRLEEFAEAIYRSHPSLDNAPLPKQSMWFWTRSTLLTYILRTLADGTEMAHSVEGRVPYLDHHLFEKAMQIRVSDNLKPNESKALLRQALRNRLPKSICERPKQPFLAPPIFKNPCPNSIRDEIEDSFRSTGFSNLPLIDSKKAISWFERLQKKDEPQQSQASPVIFTLLSAYHLQQRYSL